MINSIEKGRKEDGNRSIADKIRNRLHDLEQTIENNLGRWAWELLQNAKDSISDDEERDVCVQIELNDDSVIFKHNGAFFTELDIRGLINQISSKEAEEGEQTRNTGRFGTGFLTTHMLSRKVEISGIVKTDDDKFYSFDFLLDREGKTTAELTPKVDLAWDGFQKSTTEIDSGYDENVFNTSFCYLLETDEQKKVAHKGIVEFSKLIPYVLTFIPKIKEVNIIDNVADNSVNFKNSGEILNGVLSKIKMKKDTEISNILILQANNDKVSIAIEVKAINDGFYVKEIESIPKLFCDFPLIGSENFHLPMVVNSFFFNPLTERDGIWLKNETNDEVVENRGLLESSIELYKELMDQIEEKDFHDLYNLSTTKVPATDAKYFDRTWYSEKIQTPLRNFLKKAVIVETNNGKVAIDDINFPDINLLKNERERIWQFSSDLKENKLPMKEHIQNWANVIWNDCSKVDIADLVTDLKGKENLETLAETLSLEKSQTFDWLNDCLKFIYEKDITSFNSHEIIPNQYGQFKACNTLFLDEIEDENLKKIAPLVGYDFYEILVHKNVFLEHHASKKTIHDVAREITHLINEENQSEERKLAISMLIEWFENNSEKGKEHFADLYRKKEKLLVDTIDDKESLFSILNSDMDISEVAKLVKQVRRNPNAIIESISKAKQFDELLKEYDATSVEDLKRLILATGVATPAVIPESPSPQIEITQEILASLGVTTQKELEEALKDKSISKQFVHITTPTTEMFLYAQKKIQRAKDNILNFLNDQPDYDCSDAEELAPTVIGGIVKHGHPQPIVIRPSDNKQVIIYYDSEKDSLDYGIAELWIEDGRTKPRVLTLGKVLKSTGITKIPV